MFTDPKVKEKVEKAAQKWIEENLSDESIEDYVETTLNNQRDEIFCQLLGFERDRWDKKWKINNCNGTRDNFAAGNFIREKAGEAINKWLEENIENLPKLDKNAIASLKKNYRETYKSVLKSRLEYMAESEAKGDVDRVLNQILGV